jgi:ribosome recycling factor
MSASVAWFKKECAALETRASGYARPGMISSVRVKIPEQPDIRLEELATIGNIKHVESALYSSGIPGVVPHRLDNRTIKIPMPKPTIQARQEIFTAAKKQAEDIRVQIRKQHTASLKRGKYEKHSIELDEFQKLTDMHVQEVDKILANLQKATSSK